MIYCDKHSCVNQFKKSHNCVSNYLITGHFQGSVRNAVSRGMAGSLSQHTRLVTVSGQANFHSLSIFSATRQNLGETATQFN